MTTPAVQAAQDQLTAALRGVKARRGLIDALTKQGDVYRIMANTMTGGKDQENARQVSEVWDAFTKLAEAIQRDEEQR